MENLLREYMERAFAERGIVSQPGIKPVVTISREFGCPGKPIAQHLTRMLNKLIGMEKPALWRYISKEVVEATAKHLELNQSDVNYLLNSGRKGLIEDVLASFAPTYVSDLRIRKTITAVVRTIAEQGHVVIVGRGGAGILQNFPDTLHIRLQAPREWRIAQACTMNQLGIAEASRLVDQMDEKRTAFIELMIGGKFNPYLFSLTLNCSKLSIDEIVRTIIGLMETKKMTE
jgi:cytidylate kinase